MSTLYFVNLPHDCTERELKQWIEACGVDAVWVRIIRDLVAGVSPAFAYAGIKGTSQTELAVQSLNGRIFRNRVVSVTEVPFQMSQVAIERTGTAF